MGKSPITGRTRLILALTATLWIVPACAQSAQPNPSELEAEQVKKGKMHILKAIPVGDEARIPITKINGKSYVAAQAVADILEYRTFWDLDSLTMKLGVNDPELELKADSTKALKADKPVTLPAAPVYEKDALYIPLEAVGALFGTDFYYRSTDTEITVNPALLQVDKSEITAPPEKGVKDDLSFEDDPAYQSGTTSWAKPDQPYRATATEPGIDANKLETTAKRYLGVKYKFGTGPFSQSGFFDCSSFTQYLFDKQNVELPRTARAQAERGKKVTRKQLKPGDLLFFYVPGRFRSNNVIGHVGLYIGGGQMIHSSPEPENGVQITEINQPYWKKTFLEAARITGSGSL